MVSRDSIPARFVISKRTPSLWHGDHGRLLLLSPADSDASRMPNWSVIASSPSKRRAASRSLTSFADFLFD